LQIAQHFEQAGEELLHVSLAQVKSLRRWNENMRWRLRREPMVALFAPDRAGRLDGSTPATSQAWARRSMGDIRNRTTIRTPPVIKAVASSTKVRAISAASVCIFVASGLNEQCSIWIRQK
jgi:hypothetical protein